MGCGSEESASVSTYEEHEHHVPEHMPESFPAGIAALATRLDRLPPDGGAVGDERDEFRDIVGWLPKLAADSDLAEAEWDAIHRRLVKLDELTDPDIADTAEVRDVIGELGQAAERHAGRFEVHAHEDDHSDESGGDADVSAPDGGA